MPSNVSNFNMNVRLFLRRSNVKGLHLEMRGELRGFLRVAAGFSRYNGEFGLPLVLVQGSPIFHSSFEGELGFLSSHCRAKYTSSRPVPRT